MEIKQIDCNGLYGVTSDGKIWSYPISKEVDKCNHHNGKFLKTRIDKYGYEAVHLNKLKSKNNQFVHRLVAKAFIKNPMNYPQVNHLDGDKQNNHADNLEWCTYKQNIEHRVKNKLHNRGVKFKNNTSGYIGVSKGYKKWVAQIGVDGKDIYLGAFDSKVEAAKAYDIASYKYHGATGNRNFNKEIQ